MKTLEIRTAELREALHGVPVTRKDDPTTMIVIKYVHDLLESDFRNRPVPLLRRRVA